MDDHRIAGQKRKNMAGLGALASTWMYPAVAVASSNSGAPSVVAYTATASAAVMVVAVMALMAIEIAYGLGGLAYGLRIRLRRQIRVLFGGSLLLALVTPWVALNFSVSVVMVFAVFAGLATTAWVWGASNNDDIDPETSPPSKTA